ncbi:hypothetical protein ACFCWV_43450 [Streptomyces sp. NPDC056341]
MDSISGNGARLPSTVTSMSFPNLTGEELVMICQVMGRLGLNNVR